MIVMAFFIAQTVVPVGTTVEYRRLPAGIVSAVVYEWNDAAPPVRVSPASVVGDRTFVVAEPPGTRVVVAFARRDGAYLLDGPFSWPRQNSARTPDSVWRRTATGIAPPGRHAGSPPIWVSADQSGSWPRCRWNAGNGWECWGVAANEAGILVQEEVGTLWWCAVQASISTAWRSAQWGRLIVVSDPEDGIPRKLQLQAERAVAPPAYRFRDVRLETKPVPSVSIVQLAGGVAWMTGADVPEQAWVSIRASEAAPRFVALADLANGAFANPERIALDPARRMNGAVVAGARAAAGATVTLFRLIDPPPRPDDRLKARRVFVDETTADETGAFAFDTVGNGDYEILAWHPQLGHASVMLEPAQQSVTVRLEQAGLARGRVLVGGKPAADADVFSVPDQSALSTADDPVDVKGGDGKTDASGRFVVILADTGGGELRIGGGAYPTRRVPLPRAPLPLVDLGDIELGAPLVVRVVLDRDPGCDLIATGPVGRLGLQIVTGDRTGPGLFRVVIPEEGQWQFGLDCGGTIRSLSPTLVAIGHDLNGKEVRLDVPR